MTFFLKIVSQSDYTVSATYGETECDIRPGDSIEIVAADDDTVTLVRREPPATGNPLPPEHESYTLTAEVVPDIGDLPLTVTLTLTENEGFHPADSFTVDWGDGTAPETSDQKVLTHVYEAVGSYAGTVTATHGELSEKINMPPVNVTEPPPAKTTRRR